MRQNATLFKLVSTRNGMSLEQVNESNGNKNNLPVGTVLRLNGYCDPEFVIVQNQGIDLNWKHYGTRYRAINLETGESTIKQAYSLEWLSEKKDNRIQTYITDRIMTADEMTAALSQAQETKKQNDRKAAEAKTAREKAIAELPGKHPYLTVNPAKGPAVNIRIELKRAYPKTKFKVRTERRGTVYVSWADGPTESQVQEITSKYEYGSFNGMEDIYEYDRDRVWPIVFGGADYVFANRQESPELVKASAIKFGFDIGTGEHDNYGCLPGLDWETSQMIYRDARQTAV